MSRDERFVSTRMVDLSRPTPSALRETDTPHVAVLHLQDHLRAPINRGLRHSVRALLRRGARSVVVDLARVSTIDAAGVGELVRAYNMTVAANGILQVVNATGWVRQILERVGLYDRFVHRQAPTPTVIVQRCGPTRAFGEVAPPLRPSYSSRARNSSGTSGSASDHPARNRS